MPVNDIPIVTKSVHPQKNEFKNDLDLNPNIHLFNKQEEIEEEEEDESDDDE